MFVLLNPDGSISEDGILKKHVDGAVPITKAQAVQIYKSKRFDQWFLIDGDLVPNQPVTDAIAASESNRELELELSILQAEMASKGLYWLLKYLATTGVNAQGKVPVADIPQKLKDAQARIEQIEIELGT